MKTIPVKFKSPPKQSVPIHVNPLRTEVMLNSLTRDELRALATRLNVKQGKNKEHTIDNLSIAINFGLAHVKTVVYISTPPSVESLAANSNAKGSPLLIKKFRNYKTDKIVYIAPSPK